MKEETATAIQLRVWWIPQVPTREATYFTVAVNTIEEAKLILSTLARYDRHQFEHRIKPDFCNAGGLQVFEDGEWSDWYDDDGRSIDETP